MSATGCSTAAAFAEEQADEHARRESGDDAAGQAQPRQSQHGLHDTALVAGVETV